MDQPDFARLMDANLNRVSEGLRVLEDFFRFAEPEPMLASRLKSLRHQLRHEPARLEPGLSDHLWRHRKVAADFGPQISQQLQSSGEVRVSHGMARDYVTANCKRVQEGLRSLEEASRILALPSLSAFFEKVRYQSYDLEAGCLMFFADHLSAEVSIGLDSFAALSNKVSVNSNKTLSLALSGLYGMASPDSATGKSARQTGLALLAAGVRIVQYRNKTADTADQLADCLALSAACHDQGAHLIVNDRIDIAFAAAADGVHLGQEDLPVATARQMACQVRPGQPFWIGLSTHNPQQAQAALSSGCDYIGVGPVFATTTKEDLRVPVAGLDYVRWAAATIPLPQVAIGGIGQDNFGDVISAGARCCAMIQAVNQQSDTTAVARRIHQDILAKHAKPDTNA